MINSIIKKEWLKIRSIILTLLVICLGIIVHFWYNLDFSFSTIEPESMMWYRFTSLQQKPYGYLSYLYFIIAFCVATFQFLPERVKNRIKIMTHLPISISASLFLHLLIGSFYIFLLSFILSLGILFIINLYYPFEILVIAIKDICFYFIGSIFIYFGISATIIEKNSVISAIKLITTIVFIFVFNKTIFTTIDLIWVFISLVALFSVLDSFYSIKEQRFENILFRVSIFISIIVVSIFAYNQYEKNYKHQFNRYYIFYSPILKEFIYQKNFGDHQFEYGIKNKQTFNMDKYKSYLPFVYWRDLDIQGKLPLKIDEEIFNKQTIKDSRLSFSYDPTLLKKQEVQLYPLINPKSDRGRIVFPEEMFAINSNKIKIYNFDDRLDTSLTKEIEELIKKKNLNFPIKNIWGKATNMKPFDLGYFILDKDNKLFKLNRFNDKINLKQINYPKNIEIKFIKISENKKRELAGFAIDSKNNFYIIDYQTLKFKKLKLKNFDYKTMKLLFISNPKYFLVRYNDDKQYFAVVFNKDLKKIDEDIFE